MEQSFTSRVSMPELDISRISQVSESTRDVQERSLMDISVSTITNKVWKIKDSLFSYFGIERITEHHDTKYEELLRYAQSIREEASVFLKRKKGRYESKAKAIRNVENCYVDVPAEYFNEGLQFELVSRKRAREKKQLLEGYLDQVDSTLFGLVNANFAKYMSPMQAIQQIDGDVQSLLTKIHQQRDLLMKIQNQFIYRAIKNLKMAYISHNLHRLLGHMQYIRKIKDLPQRINECITNRKCEYSTFSQLQQSKEEEAMCQSLPCLPGMSVRLQSMKEELRMYLVGLVDSTLYRYINGVMIYDKDKWRESELPCEEMKGNMQFNPDVTILNATKLDFKQKEDAMDDLELKAQLVQLVKLCSSLEISVAKFGRKLAERLDNFSEGFQQDLNQFLIAKLGIKNNQCMDLAKCFESIQIKYYVKLVLIYFGILKGAFQKLVYLYNFGNKSLGFEEILQPFRMFIIQQIKLFMGYKKLPANVDCDDFSKYTSLIDFWIDSEEEMPELELSVLVQSKKELISIYLGNFHQQTVNGQFSQTLQRETFMPISIPSDYYVQFQNLLNPNVAQESLMLENTFNSSIRKQRRRNGGKLQTKNSVRMYNQVLNLNGENFKLCGSFLLLIEIMEEYGEMSGKLKGCDRQIEEKSLEVLAFYNQETRRLLLGNGAIKYGVVKQVSLKHLCLLARTLSLLLLILGKLCFKDTDGKHKLEQAIKEHINDICKQMSTVVVCNIDSVIQSLYNSGPIKNVLGSVPPCSQSKQIAAMLVSVKGTIVQFWDIGKAKQLLRPSLREISQLYFKKLNNQGKRGQQEISWCLSHLAINLGEAFDDQLKSISPASDLLAL